MLAIAISLAIARVFIRAKLNHKVYVDDGFFFLAMVTLVAGTIMTYTDIPYIYLQQNVQAGVEAPPVDLIPRLIHSVKLQDSAVVLLSASVFAVKLSFLAFFRSLIQRIRKLEAWWWVVLAVVVPSSLMLVVSNFISCAYFDERILVKCVTAGALKRQNDTLKAVTILDIVSDVFIITIPIALLWRVKIDMCRKIALATTLCLSIFTIITAIVRVSGSSAIDGQVDSSWVIFWLQVEAAVAVMVVSLTAFRALFVAERSQKQESPRGTYTNKFPIKYWHGTKNSDGGREQKSLPHLPGPQLTGVHSLINHMPYEQERPTSHGQQRWPSQSHSHDASQTPSSYEMV
ncbi:MAG: hypothetical protein Q9219_004075 [cf. Caloplaca sp. 3 TL-2023]